MRYIDSKIFSFIKGFTKKDREDAARILYSEINKYSPKHEIADLLQDAMLGILNNYRYQTANNKKFDITYVKLSIRKVLSRKHGSARPHYSKKDVLNNSLLYDDFRNVSANSQDNIDLDLIEDIKNILPKWLTNALLNGYSLREIEKKFDISYREISSIINACKNKIKHSKNV